MNEASGPTSAESLSRIPALEKFFGNPIPERERAMWVSLSTAHRSKAIQRMTALERWSDGDGSVDAARAAADAGVGLTRFYEMAKAWRNDRSLAALGTFAAAPKSRVGKYDATIRKLVGEVVAADANASVRKLAIELASRLGRFVDGAGPSHNTLRRYVEEELRRRERESSAGVDLQLDCSACKLTPSDERLFTAFVILDRATQVVLGAELGVLADSRAGYRGAAIDALRRLDESQFVRLPWVDRSARAEIVVGEDKNAWTDMKKRLVDADLHAGIELSTKTNRFGRYLRPATGLRIGTVVFFPIRTGEDGSTGVRARSSVMESHARLSVEVDEYNTEVISQIQSPSEASPPANLRRFLEMIAEG